MERSRFSEEKIVGILRPQEAGASTAEVCHRPGVSSPTFYKWKAKFDSLEVSEVKRLSELRPCQLLGIARRVAQYVPTRRDDA